MGKREKKLEWKFVVRRIACVISTFAMVIGIASFGEINEKRKSENTAIIKNSYNIKVTQEELKEIYNSLKVIKTNFEWRDKLEVGNEPEKVVLHHSAIDNMTIDEVHQKHVDNGWAGIGYHYFIRKDGKIYEGRPENVIGAHVKDNNDNTLGICLEGNFEEYELTFEQNESILNLLKYLFLKYDIKDIKGHRDLGKTLCPGENLKVTDIKNKLDILVEEMIDKENIGGK
ncbi:MAG: peptidoglycan recognition protein family protein [Sarcina sp.]